MEDQPKLELEAFELPGGNEPKFNKLTQEQIDKHKNLQTPREWDFVTPSDYLLDEYKVEIEKDKKEGSVTVRIRATGLDGRKQSVAFKVEKTTPYALTGHHMRAAWNALFRYQICKILDKNDEG